jgi:hypothetical protein
MSRGFLQTPEMAIEMAHHQNRKFGKEEFPQAGALESMLLDHSKTGIHSLPRNA